jgi:multidrug efflux pump subunit AcrA (membrane-fusion protein)
VRIFVYVGQSDAPFVKVGDAAHIASRELHDLFVDSKVTRVAHALDSRTRTMLVELDVPNPKAQLTPGLYVQVSLQLAVPPAPRVPAEAVFLRKGVPYVAVIDNNVARHTRVRLGQSDGKWVQVLEGVTVGQTVGLHVGDDVLDGTRVRPIEPRHPKVAGGRD